MVVGKTVDEIVMDETKDVFLFVIPTFHTPLLIPLWLIKLTHDHYYCF